MRRAGYGWVRCLVIMLGTGARPTLKRKTCRRVHPFSPGVQCVRFIKFSSLERLSSRGYLRRPVNSHYPGELGPRRAVDGRWRIAVGCRITYHGIEVDEPPMTGTAVWQIYRQVSVPRSNSQRGPRIGTRSERVDKSGERSNALRDKVLTRDIHSQLSENGDSVLV